MRSYMFVFEQNLQKLIFSGVNRRLQACGVHMK